MCSVHRTFASPVPGWVAERRFSFRGRVCSLTMFTPPPFGRLILPSVLLHDIRDALAEGVGFEPTSRIYGKRFSRPPP